MEADTLLKAVINTVKKTGLDFETPTSVKLRFSFDETNIDNSQVF